MPQTQPQFCVISTIQLYFAQTCILNKVCIFITFFLFDLLTKYFLFLILQVFKFTNLHFLSYLLICPKQVFSRPGNTVPCGEYYVILIVGNSRAPFPRGIVHIFKFFLLKPQNFKPNNSSLFLGKLVLHPALLELGQS